MAGLPCPTVDLPELPDDCSDNTTPRADPDARCTICLGRMQEPNMREPIFAWPSCGHQLHLGRVASLRAHNSTPACPSCRQPWQAEAQTRLQHQCEHHGILTPDPVGPNQHERGLTAPPAPPFNLLPLCCHRVLTLPKLTRTQLGANYPTGTCNGHRIWTNEHKAGHQNGLASGATTQSPHKGGVFIFGFFCFFFGIFVVFRGFWLLASVASGFCGFWLLWLLYLSIPIYLSIYLSFFLSFGSCSPFSFCICFSCCFRCRDETSKQASKHELLTFGSGVLLGGALRPPPQPPPRHEICTSSPTPAPATKSIF